MGTLDTSFIPSETSGPEASAPTTPAPKATTPHMAPPPADTGAEAAPGPQVAPSSVEYITLLNGASKCSQLGASGQEFVKALEAEVAKDLSGVCGIKFQSIKCNKIEAYAINGVKEGKSATVFLFFSETYAGGLSHNSPDCELNNVWNAYVSNIPWVGEGKDRRPNTSLLETITLSPEDYARVKPWAATITNIYKMAFDEGSAYTSLRAATCCHDYVLYVSTNLRQIRNFVEANDPHAIHARCDYGALVYLVKKSDIDRAQKNMQYGGNFEIAEDGMYPMFAITAYTRVVQTDPATMMQGAGYQYIPIINITDIVSVIKDPSIIALALGVAQDVFMRDCHSLNPLWLSPFENYSAQGKPNLAYMLPVDPETQTYFAFESHQETADWVFNNTPQTIVSAAKLLSPNPLLAIDIVDGRNRIPYLDCLSDFSGNSDAGFAARILSFFDKPATTPLSHARLVTQNYPWRNFIGYWRSGGPEPSIDSRYLDYFTFVGTYGMDANTKKARIPQGDAMLLLQQPSVPDGYLMNTEKYFPNGLVSMYKSDTIIIAPEFLADLMRMFNDAKLYIYRQQSANPMEMVSFLNGMQPINYMAIGGMTDPNRPNNNFGWMTGVPGYMRYF